MRHRYRPSLVYLLKKIDDTYEGESVRHPGTTIRIMKAGSTYFGVSEDLKESPTDYSGKSWFEVYSEDLSEVLSALSTHLAEPILIKR